MQQMAALKARRTEMRETMTQSEIIAYNFVGRKLGESSLFFRMSLHLFAVSNSRNVSPTENSVDRQLASSFRVGGPGDPCMCVVSCSTSFFWHALMSSCASRVSCYSIGSTGKGKNQTFCAATKILSKNRSHSNTNTGFL